MESQLVSTIEEKKISAKIITNESIDLYIEIKEKLLAIINPIEKLEFQNNTSENAIIKNKVIYNIDNILNQLDTNIKSNNKKNIPNNIGKEIISLINHIKDTIKNNILVHSNIELYKIKKHINIEIINIDNKINELNQINDIIEDYYKMFSESGIADFLKLIEHIDLGTSFTSINKYFQFDFAEAEEILEYKEFDDKINIKSDKVLEIDENTLNALHEKILNDKAENYIEDINRKGFFRLFIFKIKAINKNLLSKGFRNPILKEARKHVKLKK